MTAKADKQRFELIKGKGQDIGNIPCVPCILVRSMIRLPSVQHVVEGRKRLGHQVTYSSCEWHHFGMCFDTMTRQSMIGMLGPSLAHGKRTFQEFFGAELLLVEIHDFISDWFVQQPWLDYAVPHEMRRRARLLWTDKR